MNSTLPVREHSPLRVLLFALLAAVLLAQLAAMAFVAHSQVKRAEERDAAERSLLTARRTLAVPAAPAAFPRQSVSVDVVNVDYAFAE
ncbi:hypothetical protein ACSFA3_07850 [Variovorax sp. RHLX14]|uniref:hypothetical protein n=1 Tax=Variovorax sp. RHLX14 TaxID=1259731 RepID=UPI003F457808